MKAPSELLTASKKYKKYIWRFFYGRRKKLSNYLAEFETHEVKAMMLLSIEKPVELSAFLGQTFGGLERIINYPVYNHYQIKKKKGGWRDIYAPDEELKKIQKKLNYFLQAYYLSIKPDEVHGFVINAGDGKICNIAANARPHTHKKYVLNIDLKDFFPNIRARQVFDVFSSPLFGYDEQIATALTLLTTLKGALPIGAPTSPVISNFACLNLDASLESYAIANSLVYTRYADDITFSSNQPIISNVQSGIAEIIQDCGFLINEKKVRLITSNRKQTVTGLTVNEKVNADRKLLKLVRAMLHDLGENGIDKATKKHLKLYGLLIEQQHRAKFMNRLVGYINFIGQVKGRSDRSFVRLNEKLEEILMGTV
jgi:RNA-directed DNA polymerase